MNQRDLDMAIRRMMCIGGVDADLYKEYHAKKTLDDIMIQQEDWDLYQQYESGLQALRDYSIFTQHSRVIVHEELFESQRAMELLRAPFFEMYENVSLKTVRPTKDLTKRTKNQLVSQDLFMFE
eukprot:CAMPEP_0172299168 /NCGR_PEP_ID=MMETSP1058-20130122/1533_1 /TAXON_ID=83371 /ORGANISM="Detonula confervacea, Strain CCMP 353" /LENGTH=123 /DNA_ID=CAMNT_0013008517 /DNA_START=225 /DNA_END=593 /DNA_ORIENTATION=+